MTVEPNPSEERTTKLLRQVCSTLKLVLIVTIYFSLCVVIILSIIGARQ